MPLPWETTQESEDLFFSSLRSALKASGHDQDETDDFIAHARQRLKIWRGHPYAYLERDNIVEAREEPPDGANYAYFEGLSLLRAEQVGEIDSDSADSVRALMLEGAFHCALAHAAFSQARIERRAATKLAPAA